MKEAWKVIDQFEAYAVSSLGRIKRIKKGAGAVVGRILKPSQSFGYLRVCFIKGGKKLYRYVHVLVAKAFLPNPLNLPQVNHKGIKKDNRAHRLEWITFEDHQRDIAKRGQRGDGVFFDPERNLWRAHYFPKPNEQKYLGSFQTKKEALAVRKAALQ